MAYLVLRKLGDAVHKHLNSSHIFICPKLMMPVWVRLLFNTVDLVVYGPPGGGGLSILNALVVCSWFYFFPHPTQALVTQEDTQGYGTVQYGVFTDTGESRGCREFYAPISITPEEGGLHVRSVVTGIAYQLTWI